MAEQAGIETNHADNGGDDTEMVDTTEVDEAQDGTSGTVETPDTADDEPAPRRCRVKWAKAVAFGLLPVLAVLIAAATGYLKWKDSWIRGSQVAGIESVAAAKDSTTAILSYQPDSVDKDLGAARDRLTGKFKDSYTQLIHDVVIPGAKKDHISAVATVPAAALVSADPTHAVALVYVDQTVTVGNDAPTDTASAVRVTLEKSGNRWLISAFDPI
nr:hypothetical protein [Mycobacterium colombiense]